MRLNVSTNELKQNIRTMSVESNGLWNGTLCIPLCTIDFCQVRGARQHFQSTKLEI